MENAEQDRRSRFDSLFAAYGRDITAYCSWRTASASDAEDAAAEVFLTAWRRFDEVPAGNVARVWLYATARRVIANQRRSSRRRLALHTDSHLTPPLPDDPEAAFVRDVLSHLGPLDREVLLLSKWEGLSPAEIAAILGCPRATARGRLYRARRRFRAAFDELSEEPLAIVASRATHVLEGGS